MQSERIKEFLKYASPRLEYIEHCMEKQAAPLPSFFNTVRKFINSGQKLDNNFRGVVNGSDLRTVLDPKFKLSKDLQEYAPEYNALVEFFGPAAKGSTASNIFTQRAGKLPLYDRPLPDARTAGLLRAEELAKGVPVDFSSLSVFPTKGRQLVDARTAGLRRAEELSKRAPKTDATPEPKNAPKADADNAKGWWDDFSKGVGDWAKEHPVLTPAITAGVAAPLAGGIGYGIGHDSGFESGSSNAAAYWQMREALRNHQLRGVNSEFLTRLANLFGGGDLSRLIG